MGRWFDFRAYGLVAVAMFSGCTGRGKVQVSSDIRLDHVGDPDSADSAGTRMCVTPAGAIYVVWQDDRDASSGVWLNSSADGGITWRSDDVRVNHGDGRVFEPDVGCSDQGVFVVWEDDRDSVIENHNIYYNRSWDGGDTWLDADVLVEDDPQGASMSLGARVVADGVKVYITWFEAFRGGYDIIATASHDGEAFYPQVRLDSGAPGAAYSAWPQIRSDGAGHVYVVWEDSRDGNSDIYFAASYDDGFTFEPDVRVDGGDQPGQFNSFSPRFDADGSRIYVVWSDDRNGDKRDILMNWSPNRGVTWQPNAVRVDSDAVGFHESRYPDVIVRDGTAYFAWEDARTGAGYDIYFRTAMDSAFGAPEVRLDTDAEGANNSLMPRVAVDGSQVAVLWQERRYDSESLGYNDLYYNFSTDGGTSFERDDLRLDNMTPGRSFKVDVEVALRGGDVLASWTDGRSGTADVYFHRLALGDEGEFILVDAPRSE